MRLCLTLVALLGFVGDLNAQNQEPTQDEARAALLSAATFFKDQVANQGGYVYQYSADLQKREGEGRVELDRVWVQPPGTPYVGMGFLEAYRLCGEPLLLEAALESAQVLLDGQLLSGGWTNHIILDPDQRGQHAYRKEGTAGRKQRNHTSFDDNNPSQPPSS